MNIEAKTQKLGAEDGKLVDLVTAALVDPTLHTDTRMRLHEQITRLLHTPHAEVPQFATNVPAPAAQARP